MNKNQLFLNSRGFSAMVFILIAAVLFFSALFLWKTYNKPKPFPISQDIQSPVPTPTPIASFKPISSQGKAYPILKFSKSQADITTNFDLYQLTEPMGFTGKVIKLSHYGEGAAGQGENKPLASPDFGKVAYLGMDGLHVITGDGKDDRLISDQFKNAFFSGWSADSQKLIVNSRPELASPYPSDYNGYNYMDYDASPSAFVGYRPDFYLVDTQMGTITPLKHIGSFVTWINNDLYLVSGQDFSPYNYSILSISGKSDDFTTKFPNLDYYFGIQMSLNQDGKKWAINLARTGDNGGENFSKIILADFPQINGIEIDHGKWADVQGPRISPDGSKVAYWIKLTDLGLWQNGSAKTLFQGRPEVWVDNDRFIYSVFHSNASDVSTFLYDTRDGSSKLLNQGQPERK